MSFYFNLGKNDYHAATAGNYSASNEEENRYTLIDDVQAEHPDTYHNKIGPHVDAKPFSFSGNDKEKICDLDCLNVTRIDTPVHDNSVVHENLAHAVDSQGNGDSESSESSRVDAEYETTDVEKQSSSTNEITELKQKIGELTFVCTALNETIANVQRQLEKGE